MPALLRTKWFWIVTICVLPLTLGLAALAASPVLRVRFFFPYLTMIPGISEPDASMSLYVDQAIRTDAGFNALLSLLDHRDRTVRRRVLVKAQFHLTQSKLPHVEEQNLVRLRATIEDTDPQIAFEGIGLLALLQDRQCLDAVIARSRRPMVSSYSILCYLGMHAPEIMESVAENLLQDPSSSQWIPAMRALGRFASATTVRSLTAWAQSEDPQRSQQALQALNITAEQLSLLACRPSDPHIHLRIDVSGFQQILLETITDRNRPFVVRQRLALFIMDLEVAYRLCQGLLREAGTQRAIAEMVIQTLHCLEKEWREYFYFSRYDDLTWMSDHWQPFPLKIADDPPSPVDPVLMAVKEAILHSARSTACTAIANVLRSHFDHLPESSREFVRHLLDVLAESEPQFSP